MMTDFAKQQDRPYHPQASHRGLIGGTETPDELVVQIQNFLECWKQITHYLSLARARRFDSHDESQFLELKAIIAQELEVVLASQRCAFSPSREEVHAMITSVPSLRYLGQLNEPALRNLENQWHRIYIGWQAALGQIKAQNRQIESRPRPRAAVAWWKGIALHLRRSPSETVTPTTRGL